MRNAGKQSRKQNRFAAADDAAPIEFPVAAAALAFLSSFFLVLNKIPRVAVIRQTLARSIYPSSASAARSFAALSLNFYRSPTFEITAFDIGGGGGGGGGRRGGGGGGRGTR